MARPEVLLNHRKVIPCDGRNEGNLVSNPPDVPPVAKKEFKFPHQEKPSGRWPWDGEYGYNGDGYVAGGRAVQITVPLTSFFETSIGGGRVGGGGTSREALQRAKRKLKARSRKQEPLNQE